LLRQKKQTESSRLSVGSAFTIVVDRDKFYRRKTQIRKIEILLKKLLSRKHKWTIILVALNTVLYLCMVIATPDHSLAQQSTKTLIEWGGNYGPMTLNGEPWRLVSCAFTHSHLAHLLVNLFSLFILGRELEPMLGARKFLFIYFLSAIFGSICSVETQPVAVSVGASGAIFGVFGSTFALLGASNFDKLLASLKRRFIVFIVFLLIVVAPTFLVAGVDNSAHIGGMLAGLFAGLAFSASTRTQLKPVAAGLIALLVITPIVAFFLIGVQYRGDLRFKSQNYMIEADALIEDKKYKEALPLLDEAIAIIPAGSDPKYNKARLSMLSVRAGVLIELKRPGDALRDLEATEPICEDQAQLKRSKALAKFQQKNYDEALALYEEVLTLKPGDAHILNAIAWTQAAMGKLDDALKNADESLEKEHDATDVLDTRGTIYLLRKNYEKGLADLDHAIKIKPKSGAAYFHRAAILLEQGKLEQCDQDLKAAAELEYEPDVWEPDVFGDLIERGKIVTEKIRRDP
jgi:membrane associated rhomboid family serine protease